MSAMKKLNMLKIVAISKSPMYGKLLSSFTFSINPFITEVTSDKFKIEIPEIHEDTDFILKHIFHEIWHVLLNHNKETEDDEIDNKIDLDIENILISNSTKKLVEFDSQTFNSESNLNRQKLLKSLKLPDNHYKKSEKNNQGDNDNGEQNNETNKQLSEDFNQQLKNLQEEILVDLQNESEKNIGGVIGDLTESIQKFLKPKTSILTFINKLKTKHITKQRSFKRPSRRHQNKDFILPSRVNTTKRFNLLIYVDTSGSMAIKDLQKIMSEIAHIIKLLPKFTIKVIQGDTNVNENSQIFTFTEKQKDIQKLLSVVGRGGTDLTPFINYIKNDKDIYDLIIIASDFYVYEKDYEKIIELQKTQTMAFLTPRDSHDKFTKTLKNNYII
jgi:predicted metal-dependent peptidase